jgi:hypothetical protein
MIASRDERQIASPKGPILEYYPLKKIGYNNTGFLESNTWKERRKK